MQKWSGDNKLLMYSIHNERKSVVGKWFARISRSKSTKKEATIKKPCLSFYSLGKKPVHADYEIELSPKDPKFKVSNSVRLSM